MTLSLLHVIDRLLPWLATLAAVTSLITLLMVWSWLLDQPWGRWWPVPAALLPACIPLARSVEQDAPPLVQTSTVMALLLAVAVLQIDGQQRNQRDRIKTESALDEQSSLLNAIAAAIAEQGAASAEQSALLRYLADGIAAEEEETTDR